MPRGPYDPDRDPHPDPLSEHADFGWLYDNADDAADQTRVMPAVPAQPPRGPMGPGQGAPGPGQAPTGPGGPRRVRVRWLRIALLVLAAWIVFLIVVPLVSWQSIQRVSATPKGARAPEGSGTNYLMVGSDSRQGLTAEQQQKLGVGGVAVDHGRTDTIMVLHTGSGPTTLISIPRDSLVKIPGHGTDKINAAYYFGDAPLLVQTIEQDTGLHIDHFVEVGLGSFVQAVDAVGGVQICPDTDLVDPLANLNVKKGCQQADGATALAWARSRHAFALGDIAREEHQREIVHDVGAKAFSVWTAIFPWRYLNLASAASSTLKVDDNMSMWAMAKFAMALSDVGSGGKTCTMPLRDLDVHWDTARMTQLIHYLKTDTTGDIPDNLCTKSGLQQ